MGFSDTDANSDSQPYFKKHICKSLTGNYSNSHSEHSITCKEPEQVSGWMNLKSELAKVKLSSKFEKEVSCRLADILSSKRTVLSSQYNNFQSIIDSAGVRKTEIDSIQHLALSADSKT